MSAAGIGAAVGVVSAGTGVYNAATADSPSGVKNTVATPLPMSHYQEALYNQYLNAWFGTENFDAINEHQMDFDPDFYYNYYGDLQQYIYLHPEEVEEAGGQDVWLYNHWLETGVNEGRYPNGIMAGTESLPGSLEWKHEQDYEEQKEAGRRLNELVRRTSLGRLNEAEESTAGYLSGLDEISAQQEEIGDFYSSRLDEEYDPLNWIGQRDIAIGPQGGDIGDATATFHGYTNPVDLEIARMMSGIQSGAATGYGGLLTQVSDINDKELAAELALSNTKYGLAEDYGQRVVDWHADYPTYGADLAFYQNYILPEMTRQDQLRHGMETSTTTADYDRGLEGDIDSALALAEAGLGVGQGAYDLWGNIFSSDTTPITTATPDPGPPVMITPY